MNSTAPRHHVSRTPLNGVGTPDDRLAQQAAQRAFQNLKQTYLAAIEHLPGPRAAWLRFQIRHAAEPGDLWLLRAAVFEALPPQTHPTQRDSLQRDIASVFPSSGPNSGFAAFF